MQSHQEDQCKSDPGCSAQKRPREVTHVTVRRLDGIAFKPSEYLLRVDTASRGEREAIVKTKTATLCKRVRKFLCKQSREAICNQGTEQQSQVLNTLGQAAGRRDESADELDAAAGLARLGEAQPDSLPTQRGAHAVWLHELRMWRCISTVADAEAHACIVDALVHTHAHCCFMFGLVVCPSTITSGLVVDA